MQGSVVLLVVWRYRAFADSTAYRMVSVINALLDDDGEHRISWVYSSTAARLDFRSLRAVAIQPPYSLDSPIPGFIADMRMGLRHPKMQSKELMDTMR